MIDYFTLTISAFAACEFFPRDLHSSYRNIGAPKEFNDEKNQARKVPNDRLAGPGLSAGQRQRPALEQSAGHRPRRYGQVGRSRRRLFQLCEWRMVESRA